MLIYVKRTSFSSHNSNFLISELDYMPPLCIATHLVSCPIVFFYLFFFMDKFKYTGSPVPNVTEGIVNCFLAVSYYLKCKKYIAQLTAIVQTDYMISFL